MAPKADPSRQFGRSHPDQAAIFGNLGKYGPSESVIDPKVNPVERRSTTIGHCAILVIQPDSDRRFGGKAIYRDRLTVIEASRHRAEMIGKIAFFRSREADFFCQLP
jgi:hypothetical protein